VTDDEALARAREVLSASGGGALERVLALLRFLRTACPWDARQTPHTLVAHLLEEAHEAADAIRSEDWPGLRGELGDLLLNLAFQVVLAEEEERFDADQVADGVIAKMVRRHPHLFGLGERVDWEALKAAERDDDASALAGLPEGLDPLLRAHRVQDRAAGVGFDWDEPRGALEKLREEATEVEAALAGGRPEDLEEELGDLLFAAVNVVRLAGAHADAVLSAANRKFEERFRALEARAAREGVSLPGASLETLDRLWEAVKAEARGQPASPPPADEPS